MLLSEQLAVHSKQLVGFHLVPEPDLHRVATVVSIFADTIEFLINLDRGDALSNVFRNLVDRKKAVLLVEAFSDVDVADMVQSFENLLAFDLKLLDASVEDLVDRGLDLRLLQEFVAGLFRSLLRVAGVLGCASSVAVDQILVDEQLLLVREASVWIFQFNFSSVPTPRCTSGAKAEQRHRETLIR